MRHLKSRPLEPTFDIEPFVGLGAIQNGLVAPDLLGDEIQRLDDPEAKLLALLVLGNSNIFNVADETQLVNELALYNEGARADNSVGRVGDAEEVVFVVALRHPVVTLVPLLDVHVNNVVSSGSPSFTCCRGGQSVLLTSSVISPTVVSTRSTSRNPFP